MSLFKKNTGDVAVFQSISYVLLGMDITNLGKRLETVLTHVEDEDFIDIRDEEKLYNKTVYVLDLLLYPVKQLKSFDSSYIIKVNMENLMMANATFVNKHYDVSNTFEYYNNYVSLETSREKFESYHIKAMLDTYVRKYVVKKKEYKVGDTALVVDGYRFKFYVCIGHKTNCKSLYFLYLASYPILFLDKFQDAIDDINKTNFCYVGPRVSEDEIIRQRKNLLPLPYHLNTNITFDYPQQKNLFKDFKEFGK